MSYFSGNKVQPFSNNIFRTENPSKKQKEVYSSLASLCHAWASGNVTRGRSGASMFFENGIIYSYGHHYKAAKIYTAKSGLKVTLLNEHNYSNSTINHKWEIKKAVKHTRVIEVPNVDVYLNHDKNLEHLNEVISVSLESILKMKGYKSMDTLEEAVENLNTYCELFEIKQKIVITEEMKDLLKQCLKERAKKAKERDEKRKASELAREEKFRESCASELKEMENNFPLALEQYEAGNISLEELEEATYKRMEIKKAFGHTDRKNIHINVDGYSDRIISAFKKNLEKQISDFRDGKISARKIDFRLEFYGKNKCDMTPKYALLRVVGNKVETSESADVPLDHAVRLLKMILKGDAKKRRESRTFCTGRD